MWLTLCACACLCVCVCVCACVCAHVHTNTHTYVHTNTHTHVHTNTHRSDAHHYSIVITMALTFNAALILLPHLTWLFHVHTDSNNISASTGKVAPAKITPCQGMINLLCRVLESLVVAQDIPPFAAFVAPSLPSDTSWTLPANQPQRVVHCCLTSPDKLVAAWTIGAIVYMMSGMVNDAHTRLG